MKCVFYFTIFWLIRQRISEDIFSPCPDVLKYVTKKPCSWAGWINLTSNITYANVFLIIKISTTLYHDTFMEFPSVRPGFAMPNFTSVKATEELGTIVYLLEKPALPLYLNKDNLIPFRLDFGKNCHIRPTLETMLLNGEEICFTRQRESLQFNANEVVDCQDLQKIVNYEVVNKKYAVLEFITPVTVEGFWIFIELYEPFQIEFQKNGMQIKNNNNETYEIFNADYYMEQNKKIYLKFVYNEDISIKAVQFNGRLICETEWEMGTGEN